FAFELIIQGEDPSKAKNYAIGYGHTFEYKEDIQPESEQPTKPETPSTYKEWSFSNPDAPFKGVKPTITLVGGKPATDIFISNADWVTEETTVSTEYGDINLVPDGQGNTLVSVPAGLGDKNTATTIT